MSPYLVTIPENVKETDQRLVSAFIELCKSKAFRWSQGQMTLHQAVDDLQKFAELKRDGWSLIDAIGQDDAQAIMANIFEPFRDDLS